MEKLAKEKIPTLLSLCAERIKSFNEASSQMICVARYRHRTRLGRTFSHPIKRSLYLGEVIPSWTRSCSRLEISTHSAWQLTLCIYLAGVQDHSRIIFASTYCPLKEFPLLSEMFKVRGEAQWLQLEHLCGDSIFTL